MKVIRVGFFIEFTDWNGGINYYKNLFQAINDLPEKDIQPVVFGGKKTNLSALGGSVEIIRSSLFDRYSLFWILSQLSRRILFGRDYALFLLLKKNKIKVISHSRILWQSCSIPSIAWIPDFQHLHLPHLFSNKEILDRNARCKKIIQEEHGLILSSRAALIDLEKFCAPMKSKTFVLNFVPNITSAISAVSDAGKISSN